MADTYTIGEGVRNALAVANDAARSDEMYFGQDAQGGAYGSVTHGRDALYRWDAVDNLVKRCPFADADAPAQPVRMLSAVDVSSNQGLDISGILARYEPDHLITKLYQSVELGGNGARFSVAQAAQARARGMTQGGYGWLYDFDGARQVADFLATAQQAGIALGANNPLWLDCEDYTDSTYPSLDTIRQAVDECDRRGVACGIYTGAWWWKPRTGNSAEFAHLPLWASIYDGSPAFVGVDFGGWTHLAGKQWSGNPIDRSVFWSTFTGG